MKKKSKIKSKRIQKQPRKRILSVTIKRMVDDSPDTSWLGEYSNTPANEFSIDRAHAEDCAILTPDFYCAPSDSSDWCYWNDSASRILQRVRTFIESFEASTDHESSPNGCPEDCPACEEEQPYQDAENTVWELEKQAGECDCHGGDMGRGELRYFNPSFNYVDKAGKPDGITAEKVRKYTRQDYERMERLNRGDWCYIGIVAHAEIGLSRPGNTYLIELVHSGGLWGIESDSHSDYLESVEQEQLADLKQVLKDLGFSSRAISQAFKNVERKDS